MSRIDFGYCREVNEAFRDLAIARARAAAEAVRATARIPHASLKGRMREIAIDELFRPLLPATIGIGTGQIASHDGRFSAQIDVIIYDWNILPPMLYQTAGIFPIESVLYAIEVKTVVTRQAIEQFDSAMRQVFDFPMLPGWMDSHTGAGAPPPIPRRPISILFGFGSDLAPEGTTEIERYSAIYGDRLPAITVLCVVGRGYWYHGVSRQFTTHDLSYEYEEVVDLLGGMMNTYQWIRESRGHPNFGRYILRDV